MTSFSQFITEQFYNDALHYKFYDDKQFNPVVRNKLVKIASDFAEECGVLEHVQDIQLTGSLANYNYTKYSDLDTHILLDFKDVDRNEKLVKQALDGKRFVWNTRHNISIFGHEVELYFQDVNEPHTASGLYSLLDDRWIAEPIYNPPAVDERDVSRKADQWKADIEQYKQAVEQEKNPEELKRLHEYGNRIKDKLSRMRKDSLQKHGEFGIGNLAFKQLRNDETIKDLIDATTLSYDKMFAEKITSFYRYGMEVY